MSANHTDATSVSPGETVLAAHDEALQLLDRLGELLDAMKVRSPFAEFTGADIHGRHLDATRAWVRDHRQLAELIDPVTNGGPCRPP